MKTPQHKQDDASGAGLEAFATPLGFRNWDARTDGDVFLEHLYPEAFAAAVAKLATYESVIDPTAKD